jgi:hypothetical protein
MNHDLISPHATFCFALGFSPSSLTSTTSTAESATLTSLTLITYLLFFIIDFRLHCGLVGGALVIVGVVSIGVIVGIVPAGAGLWLRQILVSRMI